MDRIGTLRRTIESYESNIEKVKKTIDDNCDMPFGAELTRSRLDKMIDIESVMIERKESLEKELQELLDNVSDLKHTYDMIGYAKQLQTDLKEFNGVDMTLDEIIKEHDLKPNLLYTTNHELVLLETKERE